MAREGCAPKPVSAKVCLCISVCHKARCDFPKLLFSLQTPAPLALHAHPSSLYYPALWLMSLCHTLWFPRKEGGTVRESCTHRLLLEKQQQSEHRRRRSVECCFWKHKKGKTLQTCNRFVSITVVVNHFTIVHTWLVIRRLYGLLK